MSVEERIRRTAAEVFRWPNLRPEQLEAMAHVVDGGDVLVVMPTGAGKSAIYQVPALLVPGPTVVVSPQLALQHDQVAGLAEKGRSDVVVVNSNQGDAAIREGLRRVREGTVAYVFVTPEQLAKADLVAEIRRARPALFVVDEAHCVSTWGHDFRPDYRRLGEIVDHLGRPRILALTAAAAMPVRDDIVDRLRMADPLLVMAGLDRPNLALEVRRARSADDKDQAVRAFVQDAAKPGLVYVATRKVAERHAADLLASGVAAAAYHGAMRAAERRNVHESFMADELEVVVATSAFGMGVDKPNVRFVAHADVPESPDAYYQEIGRAGRDDAPASAMLFYRPEDLGLRRFFAGGTVDDTELTEVVRLLHGSDRPVIRAWLRERLGLSTTRLTRILNLLEQSEAITLTRRGVCYRAEAGTPDEAVGAARAASETRAELDRSRIEMMRGFAETTGCRRAYLLAYFGEQVSTRCGNCDTCRSEPSDSASDLVPDENGPYALNERVRHESWGPGVVMRIEQDRVTVLFEQVGYKTLAIDAVYRNGLLLPDPASSLARSG